MSYLFAIWSETRQRYLYVKEPIDNLFENPQLAEEEAKQANLDAESNGESPDWTVVMIT